MFFHFQNNKKFNLRVDIIQLLFLYHALIFARYVSNQNTQDNRKIFNINSSNISFYEYKYNTQNGTPRMTK